MNTYYRLIKPGIVYGNAMTALAGFVFASSRQVDPLLLMGMLIGISFSIAASCVVNNIIDRDIDARMERTKERALVTGRVSVRNAAIFAIVLGSIGALSLIFLTNLLTFLITLFGVIVYLALYTPLKRLSPYSTIVGALAGAVPPVVGYVAVTNTLNATALCLFLVLVCWQMIHFFAIAIFRRDEYQNAALPVMSVRLSVWHTKILMIVYAFLFALAIYALAVVAQLGLTFTIPLGLLSGIWMILAMSGFRTNHDVRWARMMFFYSLIVLLSFSLSIALS